MYFVEMSRPWLSDLIGVMKGAQAVANAIIKHQEEVVRQTLRHSSLKDAVQGSFQDARSKINNIDPSKVSDQVTVNIKEAAERLNVISKGITQYIEVTTNEALGIAGNPYDPTQSKTKLHVYDRAKDPKVVPIKSDGTISEQSSSTNCQQKTVSNKQNNPNQPVLKKYVTVKEKIETIATCDNKIPEIELSDKDKEILKRLELEHEKKIGQHTSNIVNSRNKAEHVIGVVKKPITNSEANSAKKVNFTDHSIKSTQTLASTAKERKVPSTRLERMVSFGTLGIGLGLGTLAEYTRRTFGLKEKSVGETVDSLFLTQANAERIVSTLCKVRGAALKIGQILSIQDNTVINPELQKAFERVRQSADFMPTWQVEKVLSAELGTNWRTKFSLFEEKPFAAASIGQVHRGILLDGREVAVKIQYPGVALGIQSDIENLVGIMKVWNMFPDGMFIDNLVEVAKRELAWEVDYLREAECTKKYKEHMQPYTDYCIPTVIDDLSTKQVFTTEFVGGIPVDKFVDQDINMREHICKLIMQLCLKELFVFQYMQTDPNWSNFFYDPKTRQLVLLDFGACRTYDKTFMDKYIKVINAASQQDRKTVLSISREMGFLTGYESQIMEEAHVNAVMILGQVFDKDHEYFDFSGQDVTKSIQALVPTIVHHRLCPPPEEIYSLHRKLSGVFLLCAKLRVRINCRDMFRDVYKTYKFN